MWSSLGSSFARRFKLDLSSKSEKQNKWRPPHNCVLSRAQVAEVVGAGGRGRRGPLQRFYPQCQRCSIKQAGAVRNGKRVLVLHLTWPRRGRGEQLAGGAEGVGGRQGDRGWGKGGWRACE